MHLNLLKPKQSINKAYLKEKISRSAIDLFKKNFSVFLEHTNSNKGDEEHLKSQVMFFLRDTWFKDTHHINPIGKNDLVIHNGKSTSDTTGVIVEVKSITNKTEMLTADKPNAKALHELVLYYMRERIDHNNNEIKYLVATNIDDWYLFDANEFDKKIFRNTAIKKLYELKKTDNKDNPFFYEELRKLLNGQEDMVLEATHFQIREFETVVSNADTKDDNKLIAIYKLLSPAHLLKLSFANDSNSLQPKFYSELLHLIGLAEVKEGSKKLIQRKKEGSRDPGSLLENTIIQLESHDKLSRLDKPSQYGETKEERLYAVALELVITWVNRILFLKLLEAQLISYHRGDRSYTFLNRDKIKDFDDLDKLFFRVLAKLPEERSDDIQKLFGRVPYLNSSLFEPTELEHQTLFINGLEDFVQLPLISSTVWKDINGKSLKGSLITLDYLFGFLDAYDFSSEGAEDIQEDNKTLINASVLGLIFEKINGYKDGSFFTPGFITMYMCRETIRRAVVQKFNDANGWDCKELNDLYDKIDDSKEANAIINSLKICDPAVGSGHFMVSALNEIIAIKADLNILSDREGRRLKEYRVEVVNDELVITDEEGNPFSYNPNSKESQRVQEALFHEKQSIIENCLFGVDINPNSVKICRLRLWIELLKNAYYKPHPTLSQVEGFGAGAPLSFARPSRYGRGDGPVQKDSFGGVRHLETLPNIDINIKTGNSLISRFALDADLKKALKKSKFGPGGIDSYRFAVKTYQNARNKEEKREMEQLIQAIKSDFRTEISNYDPRKIRRAKLLADHYLLTGKDKGGFGMMLFEDAANFSSKNGKLIKERAEKLLNEVAKIDASLEEDEKNIIYENAFEWRFEFPQVLNNEGDFVGFDVVIGNPPYGIKFISSELDFFKTHFQSFEYQANSYVLFFERGLKILRKNGLLDYITPATFTYQNYFKKIRNIFKSNQILRIRKYLYEVFADADIGDSVSILVKKAHSVTAKSFDLQFSDFKNEIFKSVELTDFFLSDDVFNLNDTDLNPTKFYNQSAKLGDIATIIVGIKPYQVGKGKPKQTREVVTDKIYTSSHLVDETYKLCVIGKDFHRYGFIRKPSMYLKYGDWLAESRDSAPFFEDKIILRQTSDSLIGHLDFTKSLNLNNVYNIGRIKGDYNIKYILGLLNSRLMNYLYQNISQEKGRLFAEVKKVYLEKLPIYIANPSQQHEISTLIDKILKARESGETEYAKNTENEIDQLVYQLYGLTEEEIKIVEGDCDGNR